MEPRIRERFNDDILQEMLRRYDADPGTAEEIEAAESFIYEYQHNGRELILRIGHSLRRPQALIQGEMDWINHLAAGGAQVAAAVASANGNWVETVPDAERDTFMGTAFTKAQGDHLGREEWTPEFVTRYGQALGRIHRLSRGYTVSNPAWRRFDWDDPENFVAEEVLAQGDPRVLDRWQALMTYLKALPKDESYHMIHQDAHNGNFYVDDAGELTLFDFDDCCYGHAIYDIAMVLFYAALFRTDKPAFTEAFMTDFLRGYREEVPLDAKWLAELPHFLKLREIDLYGFISRDYDLETEDDPWMLKYMDGRLERIVNDVPYIYYDFTRLASVL